MYRGIYAYPWDLVDEGFDRSLARIREAGANAVTLALSYHAGKFLRPHAPQHKVYFPEDGTVYFRPDPSRYSRVKPRLSRLATEHDVLAQIERHAPDLERVAWLVCLHNTPLGSTHLDLAVRNAYGDPYIYNLCPSRLESQEYVVALCEDVAARGVSALALETPGFLPFSHGYHHEFAMVPLNPWTEILLALCFCEGCEQGAAVEDIDVPRLRREARTALDRFFAAEVAPPAATALAWWTADLLEDPEWGAFLRWRCRLVADLVKEIRATLPRATRLAVIPTVQRPTAAGWLEGSDLRMLAEAADVLEIPAYHSTPAEVEADGWDVRRRVGDHVPLHFILRPSHPDLTGAAQVVDAASRLHKVGMQGIAFYNYGHIRLRSLEWIRDALRALDLSGTGM